LSEEIALCKYIPAGGPVTRRSAVEPPMPSVVPGRRQGGLVHSSSKQGISQPSQTCFDVRCLLHSICRTRISV